MEPSTLRILQAAAVLTTTHLSGTMFATIFEQTPCILEAPAPVLVQQFAKAWQVNHRSRIPLLGSSFFLCIFLALQEPRGTLPFKLYAAAAACPPTLLLYAFNFVVPVDKALQARGKAMSAAAGKRGGAERKEPGGEETVHAMLRRWSNRMLVNATLSFVMAVCAVWAAMYPR